MYGYAITQPGSNELDEQLKMAYDLDDLKLILFVEMGDYDPDVLDEVANFVNEDVTEEQLAESLRVALEVYDAQGEHEFTLRFEKVW